MLMLMMAAAWAQQAPCEPTGLAAIDAHLDAALSVYEALDQQGFEANLDKAAAAFPCLTEPVTPALAARFHRLRGLEAFGRRDHELSEQWFAAARLSDPDYVFPEALVPPTSPVRERYSAIDPKSLSQQALAVPLEGALLLDGRVGNRRTLGVPVIFQRTAATGEVVQGALLGATDAIPDYPRVERNRGPRVPLAIAAGVGVLGAVGLFSGAFATKLAVSVLPEERSNLEKAQTLKKQNNALVVAGSGCLAAGAGLGVAAAMAGRF